MKRIALILIFAISLYGLGRLYYAVTDGFTIENITSSLPFDESLETRPLNEEEKTLVDLILDQKFTYLGKGCQSYVFLSEDQQYVLKFFKYQRYKPQAWLSYLSFIPQIKAYQDKKAAKKLAKLKRFQRCWCTAFNHAQEETGLVYVHLNKDSKTERKVTIYDKMGYAHVVLIENMEFLIQKKATMLCTVIDDLMRNKNLYEAQNVIEKLIAQLLAEYQRGLADNDHAIMQNTGVLNGRPFHIDVGQITLDEGIRDPERYQQDLFNKTYKLREWLHANHPQLHKYLEARLMEILGDKLYTLKPQLVNV